MVYVYSAATQTHIILIKDLIKNRFWKVLRILVYFEERRGNFFF